MAGVGLTKIFGVLGKQAHYEVETAEVTVPQSSQPGRISGSIEIGDVHRWRP
jgi:hypothetical protein